MGVSETTPSTSCGPGGIVWSFDGVATVPEIVNAFNAIPYREVCGHNWGTCGHDCEYRDMWRPTNGTYINGVSLIEDCDYIMCYLVHAVDRETSICTYIAVVHFYGPHPETGEQQHDYQVWNGPTVKFFESPAFQMRIKHWALDAFEQMMKSHFEAPDYAD